MYNFKIYDGHIVESKKKQVSYILFNQICPGYYDLNM